MPRLDNEDRWIGGVCAALAAEIGVQALVVRASFLVLAFAGGWGLLLYAASWAFLILGARDIAVGGYEPTPKGASSFHRHLAIFLIVVAIAFLTQSLDVGLLDELTGNNGVVWPIGFVVVGGLIAWTQGRDSIDGLASVARIIVGAVIAVAGIMLFLGGMLGEVGLLVSVILIFILGGLFVVFGPSLVRMGTTINRERSERIRSEERAEVAAHLHDSVLQTLALIQRSIDDKTAVLQLARQQERELRGWLYGTKATTPGATRIGPAVEEAAAQVESMHGVPIEVVSVGDSEDYLPEDIHGLVAAAREAMVNASKHSEAGKIDVFVERTPDTIEVYIRDTGVGFDPASVAQDRRGLSDSVVGRMARIGGTATIDTEPGVGTEIELKLPTVPSPNMPASSSPTSN